MSLDNAINSKKKIVLQNEFIISKSEFLDIDKNVSAGIAQDNETLNHNDSLGVPEPVKNNLVNNSVSSIWGIILIIFIIFIVSF